MEEKFDKIIIALENKTQADTVHQDLIHGGINLEMIIRICRKIPTDNENPYKINSHYDDEIMHVGINGEGGLGDTVLALTLLHRLKEMLGNKVEVNFISKYKEMLDYVSCVDYTYESDVEQVFDIFIKKIIYHWLYIGNPKKLRE